MAAFITHRYFSCRGNNSSANNFGDRLLEKKEGKQAPNGQPSDHKKQAIK